MEEGSCTDFRLLFNITMQKGKKKEKEKERVNERVQNPLGHQCSSGLGLFVGI